MIVYVLNNKGIPLMPTTPPRARHFLKNGEAKVVSKTPFVIKFIRDTDSYTQEVIAGMDTGSKTIGCAAIGNKKVLYQSEVTLRNDITGKMQQRKMYRVTRRARKTRYRPARWRNRASSKAKGRLAPSIRSKVESHLREKNFVESILPVSRWKVELAQFDIHKITNPNVSGVDYQNGNQKGYYNTKTYVLDRDGYKCQSGQIGEHSDKLEVHHIVFRSNGGSNASNNLICLCERCHKNLHSGLFSLRSKKTKTKHATEVGIVKGALLRSDWVFDTIYGYETKYKREQILRFSKSHFADAVAIAYEEDELVILIDVVYYKRCVSKGDYRQSSGSRSEKLIPTGKLFGLRKFDLIKTIKGVGFVKGKRSRGFFALMDIHGKNICSSVNVKKDMTRLKARSSVLIDMKRCIVSRQNAIEGSLIMASGGV